MLNIKKTFLSSLEMQFAPRETRQENLSKIILKEHQNSQNIKHGLGPYYLMPQVNDYYLNNYNIPTGVSVAYLHHRNTTYQVSLFKKKE